MINKISLQWRITIFTSLLIAVCCVGLSVFLNISAYHLADSIDAISTKPAETIDDSISIPVNPYEPAETLIEAKHDYRMESLLYTFAAVLFGGVLTYYISGKALKPLVTLNGQVKNMNMHNLNESLEIPQTKDEIAELTMSFNIMTDKLAESFAMQERFSADAAHELKTPLAVLQTKLDVLKKKKYCTLEDYENVVAVFQKHITRMRNLVTELLEIADMNHEIHMHNISLDLLLSDVVNDLIPIADEKNIEICLRNKKTEIFGSYSLLYRLFYNLTENAIKYNIINGKVIIDVLESSSDFVSVSITDTGFGIPEDMKKHVFEPFYRVDKSRSREMGGAGLGLAMANDIVKKHKGTITITDNDKNGSCFTVKLPRNNQY